MSTIATRIAAASVASSIAVLGFGAASGQAASAFDGKSLKAGSITAGKVRKDTLTGVQIRESTLGLVPIANLANLAKLADNAKTAQEAVHAANADHAKTADSAKNADKAKEADHATTATTADTAKDSDKLDGRDSTEFLSNKTRVVATVDAGVSDGLGGATTASCEPTEKATGGGGGWYIAGTLTATTLDARIGTSSPIVSPEGDVTGWRVVGRNATGATRDLRAYVICVPKSA